MVPTRKDYFPLEMVSTGRIPPGKRTLRTKLCGETTNKCNFHQGENAFHFNRKYFQLHRKWFLKIALVITQKLCFWTLKKVLTVFPLISAPDAY